MLHCSDICGWHTHPHQSKKENYSGPELEGLVNQILVKIDVQTEQQLYYQLVSSN